jgi:hypothetical protein
MTARRHAAGAFLPLPAGGRLACFRPFVLRYATAVPAPGRTAASLGGAA